MHEVHNNGSQDIKFETDFLDKICFAGNCSIIRERQSRVITVLFFRYANERWLNEKAG